MSSAFYPPARPLSVGEVLDLAFQIFKATLVKGLPYGICAMVAMQLPNIYDLGGGGARNVAHEPFGGGRPIWMMVVLVGSLLALVSWSALLQRQSAMVEHRPTATRAELAAALRRLPSFLFGTLLFFLAVGGEFGLVQMVPVHHRTLVVIPLVMLSSFLAVLLSCTWPAVLFIGAGPVGALRQSARLVWGNWWRVAAIYAVGAAVVLVVAILVGALIAMVVAALGADIPVMTAVFTVVTSALGAVAAPFAGALLLATFGDLRARRDGVDLQQRIAGLAVE